MLTSLRVRSFKAVADSGEIELAPLNVFIGRNGSGKSSILEFLEVVSNTVESDLAKATSLFQRGRDLVHSWTRAKSEAVLSLEYAPGDVSAGDRLAYEFGLRTDADGDRLRISRERLSAYTADEETRLIDTMDEVRTYRVPSTVGTVKERSPHSRRKPRDASFVAESWLKMSDNESPALRQIDRTLSAGGFALRTALESAVFLRLSPSAMADFSPRWRRRGPKAIDPQGRQTAELLASLSDDGRDALLDRLRFVTSQFGGIESHRPTGPADQRYFSLTETSHGRKIEIPAWVLSEGTRRLAAILALTLLEPAPPLIAVEEVENGFDPWTLQFLIEELERCTRHGTQILLTSHSPLLMNMLPRSAFHIAQRDKRGVSFMRVSNANISSALAGLGVGDIYTGNLLRTR